MRVSRPPLSSTRIAARDTDRGRVLPFKWGEASWLSNWHYDLTWTGLFQPPMSASVAAYITSLCVADTHPNVRWSFSGILSRAMSGIVSSPAQRAAASSGRSRPTWSMTNVEPLSVSTKYRGITTPRWSSTPDGTQVGGHVSRPRFLALTLPATWYGDVEWLLPIDWTPPCWNLGRRSFGAAVFFVLAEWRGLWHRAQP